ncbi:DegT/DnrJ/EryC1/StrS family aminotransferase [Rickettsiales bacterium]|nr:DegT/DnrJ/EryC1/StrS family aminotransferase [Rickettsiales bacterium]
MTNKLKNPLYISSPLLPDLQDFNNILRKIWDKRYVTNHGFYHNKLEMELKNKFSVPNLKIFNNGTIALLVALKMFDFNPGDEIITTPFTFAATPHSIIWNNLKPVFVDIEEESMNIDPESIEMAITPKTKAILAVHVYGNICNLEKLDYIAKKYNLKLIYDSSHAFNTMYKGKHIGLFGDASTFSFHATKLFNTIEGGAIITPNISDAEKLYMLRNFGIKNEEEIIDIGINGKLNEIQAAIGLLNLNIFEDEVQKRKILRQKYNKIFSNFKGILIQDDNINYTNSQQYYPIRIVETKFGTNRDKIYSELKRYNIFARKYFHPIATEYLPYKKYKIYSKHIEPIVHNIKNEVLCMPFHSLVSDEELTLIYKIFDHNYQNK